MTQTSLLGRYAKRLGLSDSDSALRSRAEGPPEPILELLDEILVAHTHAICFENLDVTAYRAKGELKAVAIDVDGVADKLLTDGRGGYCHEHATLIRGVVTELGLRAHPVLARVHLGDQQTAPGALTHQATIVDLDGRRYLVDPGFGGGTPEAALELSDSAEARMTLHGEHRLVPAATALRPELLADSDWAFQSRTRGDQEFRTVYAFSEVPRQQVDLELANWFTSTKPGARFTGPPILALPLPAGGRVTLEGRHLRRVLGGARPDRHERTLTDAAEFAEVLAVDFGLDLDREFTDLVWSATSDN